MEAKMSDFKIIVDSSCDLPSSFVEAVNADVASLVVSLGERVFRDRKDITSHELFDRIKETHILPTTSALNVNDLTELFKVALSQNKLVIFLTVSSKLSGLYEKAIFAREQIPDKDRLVILDSQQISSGIALLAMAIRRDLDSGKGLDQIIASHKDRVPKVHMSFVIDKLDHLNHGGRCSGLTFFIGSKLRLHPIIAVDKGEMAVRKLVTKTNIDKGIDIMVQEFKDDLEKGNVDLSYPILVPTCLCPNGIKRMLHDLTPLVGEKILFPVEASAVIASHCGSNAIGLAYMKRVAD